MSKITNVKLPKESISMQFIGEIDYVDAFKVKLSDNTQKVDSLYMAIFNHVPKWVNVLMGLRNKIVGVFGLDTGDGSKQKEIKSLTVGDKHGVFKIFDIQPNEIIAGEDDKHLDFRVSVLKNDDYLILSTLVHYNSGFGKVYFFIIKPFHKVVVKVMMRNALKTKRI
jgi:hypothetical protein